MIPILSVVSVHYTVKKKKLIDSVLDHVLILFFDPFFEQGAMYIMISDTQLFKTLTRLIFD